jgi:hypothetical protein
MESFHPNRKKIPPKVQEEFFIFEEQFGEYEFW